MGHAETLILFGRLDGRIFYGGAGLTPMGKEPGAKVGQMLASASAPARAVVPRGDIAQSTNRSYIGGAVASGNDGADEMDCGAPPHGHLDLSQSPTVLETAGKRTMRCENTIILRTDPFM